MFELLARFSPREKLIVVAGLLLLAGIGLHAAVIEPYGDRVAELREAIVQQREDLNWMRSAVAELPISERNITTVKIDGTLANFINQAVRRQGLSGQLSQMSPIGDDEVRMRYSAVDFNRLIEFVAQLSVNGLEVKDMRITAADDPGNVDCSIVLVRR